MAYRFSVQFHTLKKELSMKKIQRHYSEQARVLSNHIAQANEMAGGHLSMHTQICADLYNLINETHTNPYNKVNLIHSQNSLQSAVTFGIISAQSQKTTASRGKLNLQTLAHSTPKACFFMRNNRTPSKKDAVFGLFIQNPIFSMVERNRKGIALCCFPMLTVFHPVTFYRQTVESLAVVPKNLTLELLAMIYKFLCVNRTLSHFNLCVITLNTTTEEQARLCLSSDFRYVATIARINPKSDRTFADNNTLSISAMGVNHA